MIQKLELMYKTPNSMRKPEGKVSSFEIDGFQGKEEYVIKGELILEIEVNDTFLMLRINEDRRGNSYSSMEHVYGRFNGNMIHLTNFRPAGIQGGLFVTRTHSHKKSTITTESKLHISPFYPKIHLETIKPNFIISNHDNWILEDVSSIYDTVTPEIRNMIFYTVPSTKFYGYLEIYHVINE